MIAPATVGPQTLADARLRLTNALTLVARKRDVDGARHIEWPARVTFSLSARQRADGRLQRFLPSSSSKPVTRRGMIVAWIALLYAGLYALGGFVYHIRDLPVHELVALGIALRAAARFAQQRDYRRYVSRLQLSKMPDETMTLDLDDAGVRISGDSNATYGWDEIRSVDYYEGNYRMDVPGHETLVIPRTAFADDGERFKRAVEARFVGTYLLRKPSQGTSVIANANFRGRPYRTKLMR